MREIEEGGKKSEQGGKGWRKVGKHPDKSPARRPAAVVTTTGVSQTP